MADDPVTMQPGDVVAGRYRVEARIGQGGFGVVFKATQLPIGRTVALKMLHLDALAQEDGRARFRREAELAQKLEHPNVVRLYDFGETEKGLPFIAWEFLNGKPLEDVLAEEGPFPPARVARIAAQILKALMAAHEKGIVHRDVKPSNVLLCAFPGERDFVKVLDFGIAKDTFVNGTWLTRQGLILGTPAYMAPEQVTGGPISPAADLYALGLVMAELCTGQIVFPSMAPLEVVTAQLSDAPVPLSAAVLGSPLGPVIARATQKRLEARFASGAEMLAAIEQVVTPSQAVLASMPPPAAGASAPVASTPSAPVVAPPSAPLPGATFALAETAAFEVSGSGGASPPDAPASPTQVSVAPVAPMSSPAIATPPPSTAGAKVPASPGPARSAVLVAAGVVAVLVAAAIAVLLYARANAGATFGIPLPGHATSAAAPGAQRRFAHLTNKQIRARIEGAGFKIERENSMEPATYFILTGINRYVFVGRYADTRSAEAMEAVLTKQSGATARDGSCILHVDLASTANARLLLEHITR